MFLVAILGLDVGAHNVVAGQDVNVIVELNNMSFTTYGTHRFELTVDGQPAGDLPVSIVQMQPPGERRRAN